MLESRRTGDRLCVHLSGEIDHCAASALRGQIEELLRDDSIRSLWLDFTDVSFMDSSGIAVALRGWQRMRELGGSVTLRHVAPQPRKVFEAAGIGRMMTIA